MTPPRHSRQDVWGVCSLLGILMGTKTTAKQSRLVYPTSSTVDGRNVACMMRHYQCLRSVKKSLSSLHRNGMTHTLIMLPDSSFHWLMPQGDIQPLCLFLPISYFCSDPKRRSRVLLLLHLRSISVCELRLERFKAVGIHVTRNRN